MLSKLTRTAGPAGKAASKWCRRFSAGPATASASSSSVKFDGIRTVPASAPHLPKTSESTSDLLPSFTPSLLDAVFNRTKMSRVPLTIAYPTDLPEPTDQPLPALSEDAQISTLPNGLRVVTLPSHSPIASVGVFVDTGSRYETAELSGITHFLEVMSLKSTVNRTDFRLVREMLKMGANVSAASSREHFMYAADCLKEHVPAILGTLSDVMQHHIFHIEELLEEKEMYEEELKDKEKMMELRLLEAIHEAAWNNNTVGLPLYAPSQNLPYFTSETLKQYQRTYFTPKRMVITAIGYEHQQLVDLVQATFTSLPPDVIDPSSRQPAEYTGGDVRVHKKGDEGLVHIALAFETANWHDKDLLPMCVLQLLMGGGGSFSAGGPGKGMYSRLYNNILNKYDWAESASSFNAIYNDTAIFGIYGTTVPDKAKNLIDVIVKEFIGMAGSIGDEELQRAKNQLKSSIHMQLESRAMKLEDIGRQVMTYGKYTTAAELTQQVDRITASDLQRVAAAMIKTPLSFAGIGDLSYTPRYDLIQTRFTQHANSSNNSSGNSRSSGSGGSSSSSSSKSSSSSSSSSSPSSSYKPSASSGSSGGSNGGSSGGSNSSSTTSRSSQ